MTVLSVTPGKPATRLPTAMGKAALSKRVPTHTRSAWARLRTISRVAFRPIINPNRLNATVTDRKTRADRTGFRRSAAQTSGKNRIAPSLLASSLPLDWRQARGRHKPLMRLVPLRQSDDEITRLLDDVALTGMQGVG